jgi:hypothetical protein
MAMEMSPDPLSQARNPRVSPAEKEEAQAYLQTLINKTLQVYTTDARLFVGTFKCTDPVSACSFPSHSPREY